MRKTPCVFIVGAGPGDPGLISVRGQRHLEAADVVVYDHQVHARPAARRARGRREDRRRRRGAARPRPGRHLPAARREGARGKDRRPPQVGRSVRVRQRRQGSAVPARAAGARSRSSPASRRRSASPPMPAFPITYPGAGDIVTLGARPRGGDRRSAAAWTGSGWPDSTARSCATRARGRSARS